MCRTLHLALLNFIRLAQAHISSLVCLEGIPSFQRVNHTTEPGVVGKLAEGALSPTVHVADKGVRQHQSQYQSLRKVTRHWSLLEHQAIDRNILGATIQPVPYPLRGPSVESMSLHFRDKDVVWDSVKCFAQVQVDDISFSALTHQHSNPVIEGHQICQAYLSLVKP